MAKRQRRKPVAKRRTRAATPVHKVERLTVRYQEGKALRSKVARNSHAEWRPAPRRPDPIDLLERSSVGRLPDLVPIRYGRMLQSPFTFFRGAAAIMAEDLSTTPVSGIQVQACGDCHLLNFGGFATPERLLIFDINDFDETLPAPWEWDLKRLATSFVVASRSNGFKPKAAREAALTCVAGYREHMAEFAAMRALEVWYTAIDVRKAIEAIGDAERRMRMKKRIQKLASKNVAEDDFPKLTQVKKGRPVIKDNPPLIFHAQEHGTKQFQRRIQDAFKQYRETLPDDRRVLLDRYQIVDIAMKVVGVGSVGTRCGVLLMMAAHDDALFLQVKEARVSVLEPYAGKSLYSNRGQRVVIGQRLMQSASDIFLGWTKTDVAHFYIRQLRDFKLKPAVETFDQPTMNDYASLCGWGLARAHAKAGDAERIAGYMGKSDSFDEAMADFAVAYADQNERDHAALVAAVRNGRIKPQMER